MKSQPFKTYGEFDFHIAQGGMPPLIFSLKDSDGEAINLTGYTARMKIRDADGNELASYTTEAASDACRFVVTSPATLGTLEMHTPDAVSAAWTWIKGYYDLEIVVGGKARRMLKGIVYLDREQTR